MAREMERKRETERGNEAKGQMKTLESFFGISCERTAQFGETRYEQKICFG